MCVRTHFTSDALSTFDILNINGVNNKLVVHPDLLNSYTVLGILPFYHFKVTRLQPPFQQTTIGYLASEPIQIRP